MTVLAVLQARMDSTRLPGKVLAPIMGRPMLGRQLDRVTRSKLIERLVVAIGDDDADDPLAEFLGSGCTGGVPTTFWIASIARPPPTSPGPWSG
jgi:spore coat polysaccharide biosynthesis protein SpsF (cytidylyltransferase family)